MTTKIITAPDGQQHTIKVIPARESQSLAYENGFITYQGRTYRVRRSTPVGDRGWQLTARIPGDTYDRFFFMSRDRRVVKA